MRNESLNLFTRMSVWAALWVPHPSGCGGTGAVEEEGNQMLSKQINGLQ